MDIQILAKISVIIFVVQDDWSIQNQDYLITTISEQEPCKNLKLQIFLIYKKIYFDLNISHFGLDWL